MGGFSGIANTAGNALKAYGSSKQQEAKTLSGQKDDSSSSGKDSSESPLGKLASAAVSDIKSWKAKRSQKQGQKYGSGKD
jgi:hypothetical protein